MGDTVQEEQKCSLDLDDEGGYAGGCRHYKVHIGLRGGTNKGSGVSGLF